MKKYLKIWLGGRPYSLKQSKKLKSFILLQLVRDPLRSSKKQVSFSMVISNEELCPSVLPNYRATARMK